MNFQTQIIFVIALACFHVTTEAERVYLNANARELGDYIYFTEEPPVSRHRLGAKAFCEQEQAELPKVTDPQIYNFLRLKLSRVGRYWIDGKDSDDISRFQLDDNCSDSKSFDLSSIRQSVNGTACLSLVKGNTINTSMIQAVPCTTGAFVVCAFPKYGCRPKTTTSATTYSESPSTTT